MVVGGAMMFLFSFFSFVEYGGLSVSAWGSGTFPLASIPAILGGAMVIVVVVEQAGVKLPGPVLTFTWPQIKLTWGIVAATVMLSYLVLDKGGGSLKFGGIIMLLGSIVMAVGTFMGILGKGTNLVTIPGLDRLGRWVAPAAAAASSTSAAAAPGLSEPSRAGRPGASGDEAAQSAATISAISSPASVGLRPTLTPAARRASIFPCAVPLPPETMAPAWPIFFPAGAVTPAM